MTRLEWRYNHGGCKGCRRDVTVNPVNGDESKVSLKGVRSWRSGCFGEVTPIDIWLISDTRNRERVISDKGVNMPITLRPRKWSIRNYHPIRGNSLALKTGDPRTHKDSKKWRPTLVPADIEYSISRSLPFLKTFLVQARPESVWGKRRRNRCLEKRLG